VILDVLVIALGATAAAIVVYLVLIGFVLDLSVPPQPLEPSEVAPSTDPPAPRRDLRFEVDGTSLSAWLFLPEAASGPVPCIVMGHGFAGTKECGLADYAARFRQAGFAVLVFDYRYFGESEGEPRQLYWIPDQLADWAAAVAFARGLPEVDPEQIALWGSSASGGHVLVTAAADARIACVSAQCPSLDPRTDGQRLRKSVGTGPLLRLVMHGQRDMLRSRFGLSAHKVPVVGPPGTVAFLATPDAYAGYSALAPKGFVNEVCARTVLRATGYRPIAHAKEVRCPVLLQVCEQDQLVSPESAEQTAAILGDKAELARYPIGHFDIYRGEPFEAAVRDQIAFFEKHL
jgi:fermentation-respiration switch protein FrsA (DUF1100 family)